ncbi:MAG: flotillin domain-containing protein [Oscillospiraceae bacterium]
MKNTELAIKKAELKKEADIKQAVADAAYRIQQEEQRKSIAIASADAKKYEVCQEADGIRARGLAEADSIRAKALAEAEGIDKKAEAMTKMGQAAVLEMYFKALPDVVRNAAEPLSKVDKITMYGDGNSAKLIKDIIGSVTQVTDGLKEATGVDLSAVLSGFLGGKLVNDNPIINVNLDPSTEENTENKETIHN